MAVIETRYTDDEHLEVVVDGEVVAEANHDSHGWDGIRAVEEAVNGIRKALDSKTTIHAEQPPGVYRDTALSRALVLSDIVSREVGAMDAESIVNEAKRFERYLEKGE